MSKNIAELIFPKLACNVSDFEATYPLREDSKGVTVFTTRFAPSPTGYMHIGGLYIALINKILTFQNIGVFILRIEDTDLKRYVENGVKEIIETLKRFNIFFDEGPSNETEEYGLYGPYRQTLRKEIYQAYAKHMIEHELAYPCFCTATDVSALRERQQIDKSEIIGYSAQYATCRYLKDSEIEKKILQGERYIIRLKSVGKSNNKRNFHDGIRGTILMNENIQDAVIIKNDGLPTYHFAHAIDDHLMRTTHVIRADEWIPSIPLHVQMFEMLGFDVPQYFHVSPILKMDGTSKRKLSKRKDPEARVRFYDEMGYPVRAVIDYLLTICSSNFEPWRREHYSESYLNFQMDITTFSLGGALFDFDKLNSISRTTIRNMENKEVLNAITKWAFDIDGINDNAIILSKKIISNLISSDIEWFQNTVKLWHDGKREDVAKWSDLLLLYPYLYIKDFIPIYSAFPETLNHCKKYISSILFDYNNSFDINDNNEIWFDKIKTIGEKYHFALKVGQYKKEPQNFNGSIVDIAAMLRFSLTGKVETPDLYTIIQLLGAECTLNRNKSLISSLKNEC